MITRVNLKRKDVIRITMYDGDDLSQADAVCRETQDAIVKKEVLPVFSMPFGLVFKPTACIKEVFVVDEEVSVTVTIEGILV